MELYLFKELVAAGAVKELPRPLLIGQGQGCMGSRDPAEALLLVLEHGLRVQDGVLFPQGHAHLTAARLQRRRVGGLGGGCISIGLAFLTCLLFRSILWGHVANPRPHA